MLGNMNPGGGVRGDMESRFSWPGRHGGQALGLLVLAAASAGAGINPQVRAAAGNQQSDWPDHCQDAGLASPGGVAIKALPGEHEALIGTCFFRRNDFASAVTHLKSALQESPGDKRAAIFLARAYASKGAPDEGIRVLKEFQARKGDDTDVLYWTGVFYDQLAEQTYQSLAKSHPDSYLVLATQGDQFLQQQKYDEAVKAYQKALHAAPDAPGLHFDLGNAYWRTAKLDQAVKELEAELRLNPSHAQANYELGDIAVKQGDVNRGSTLLRKALALDPNLVEAHRSLGRALMAELQYAEAAAEFSLVAKAEPSDHTIHALLANAYQRMGQTQEAERETRRSNELLKQQMNELERKEAEQNRDAKSAEPLAEAPQN